MSNIKKTSRAVARELETWLLELADLIAAGSAPAKPAKKKRGRPAKKKKPGRPAKKKPGRPAKKKKPGRPAKKKPGRPKKKAASTAGDEPKKRGRPAKKKAASVAKEKAASVAKGAPKKRGRRPGGNLDKIKKAVGKRGARIKDIAAKTGIAASNVSNYVSQNPGVFVKPTARGGKVSMK